MNWHELFGLHSSLLDPIIRGTIMYLALFLLFRCVIRRRVGAVGMSDMLLIVVIADAAQSGLSGEANSITDALLVVATIFAWNWIIDALNYYVPALKNVLEAPPLLLIDHGRVNRRHMRHRSVAGRKGLHGKRRRGERDQEKAPRARFRASLNQGFAPKAFHMAAVMACRVLP